jgi:hypothetical protein
MHTHKYAVAVAAAAAAVVLVVVVVVVIVVMSTVHFYLLFAHTLCLKIHTQFIFYLWFI